MMLQSKLKLFNQWHSTNPTVKFKGLKTFPRVNITDAANVSHKPRNWWFVEAVLFLSVYVLLFLLSHFCNKTTHYSFHFVVAIWDKGKVVLRCYFSGVVVLFQIWSSLSGLFYFILFSRCGLPLVYVKVVELVCLSGGGCE